MFWYCRRCRTVYWTEESFIEHQRLCEPAATLDAIAEQPDDDALRHCGITRYWSCTLGKYVTVPKPDQSAGRVIDATKANVGKAFGIAGVHVPPGTFKRGKS
jgi:hypothetical protein